MERIPEFANRKMNAVTATGRAGVPLMCYKYVTNPYLLLA